MESSAENLKQTSESVPFLDSDDGSFDDLTKATDSGGSLSLPEDISPDLIRCLISKEENIEPGKFSWCKGPAVAPLTLAPEEGHTGLC